MNSKSSIAAPAFHERAMPSPEDCAGFVVLVNKCPPPPVAKTTA